MPDASWSDDEARELVEGHANELQCELVRILARSEKFPELPGHLQRQFTEFLRRFLRVKEGKWRNAVSVEEAGAAIERGGRFTDALGFYWTVAREANFSGEEKQFARHRWLVSKTRQLEYEREQGSKSRRASDVQREITEAMARLGIKSVGNLPRYPILAPFSKPLKTASTSHEIQAMEPPKIVADTKSPILVNEPPREDRVELPERLNVRIGEFTIDLSRQLGRCNISHGSTMQTAFLNIQNGKAGGEKSWDTISSSEWLCTEWSLRAMLADGRLELTFNDIGIRILVDEPFHLSTERVEQLHPADTDKLHRR